jgi:lysophospholipase L1-like esterase
VRRFAAVVVVLVATLLGVPSVASASAASRDYVALGDSYSSGVGTRTYFPDSGVCARSPLAYPSLYRATHRISSFAFVACAGATVADVTGQLSAVTRQTDLVTMTVGGNDVGFCAVLAACSAPPRSPEQCQAAVAAGQAAISTIPARVTGLLANIQARVNPGTEVVVLGYPRLFGAGPCTAPGLPISSIRNAIDDGTDRLNQAISEAAQTHGALFVDASSKFAGHGACAVSKSQWITLPRRRSARPTTRTSVDMLSDICPPSTRPCAVRPSPPN